MSPLPFPTHALQGFRALLNGLSQIFLQAHPDCGLLVLLAISIGAPQLLGGALLGGLGSTLTAQHRGYAKADIKLGLYGYNAALAAIALSQVHRRPWLPALGIVLALVLQPGFSALGLPALTMPFILTCWLVNATQRLLRKAAADCTPLPPNKCKSLHRQDKTP